MTLREIINRNFLIIVSLHTPSWLYYTYSQNKLIAILIGSTIRFLRYKNDPPTPTKASTSSSTPIQTNPHLQSTIVNRIAFPIRNSRIGFGPRAEMGVSPSVRVPPTKPFYDCALYDSECTNGWAGAESPPPSPRSGWDAPGGRSTCCAPAPRTDRKWGRRKSTWWCWINRFFFIFRIVLVGRFGICFIFLITEIWFIFF